MDYGICSTQIRLPAGEMDHKVNWSRTELQTSNSAEDPKIQALVLEAAQFLWPEHRVRLPLRNPVIWLEQEGCAAGFLLYAPVTDTGLVWMDLVYVRPDARRLGICRTLLQHLVTIAAGQKAANIAGSVHARNEPMVAALLQLGFKLEPDSPPFLLASKSVVD